MTIISCSSPSQNHVDLEWRPLNGKLKLNFDGASKGNPGPAGLGASYVTMMAPFAKLCVAR